MFYLNGIESGLRNSERLSPSQTCPRQNVPQKGKPHAKVSPRKGNPTAKVSPRKGNLPTPKCPPLERKRPPPGASVRRPTLYNIWYNFLIIFINNTITCIL